MAGQVPQEKNLMAQWREKELTAFIHFIEKRGFLAEWKLFRAANKNRDIPWMIGAFLRRKQAAASGMRCRNTDTGE